MIRPARVILGMVLMVVVHARAQSPATAPAVTVDPPRDQFLLVPLHVHILSCDTDADLNATLTDADVRRIIGKANAIWHKAGIHLTLQPILHEPAARVTEFHEQMKSGIADLSPRSPYRLLAPEASHKLPGLHVYYIHQFAPNGVYLGDRTCFVKDTAKLRPVAGGIDEPIPRVTAHELGHALGLRHRQDTFNLLASGTTGTQLSPAEVAEARKHAQALEGTLTVPQAEAKADSAGIREALQSLPR